MHTTHSGNRKSKSNSSPVSIKGVDTAEWDAFLQENCGDPNAKLRKFSPEITEFICHARDKGYLYTQIAKAVIKKYGVSISVNTCSNYYKEAQESK